MNKLAASKASLAFNGRRRIRGCRRVRGYSLTELLAVVALLGVLTSMAAPAMSGMLHSYQLTSAANDFLAHLHLARSEAIKRNSRVAMCKSGDGISCAVGGGWEQGWIVFHDANNNGLREVAEDIIRRETTLATSLRLTGNLNVAHYVSFAGTGATKLVGGGFQAGTVTVCHYSAGSAEARQIVLNAVGRPRVQKTSINSCL